jgi:hypothetical protein
MHVFVLSVSDERHLGVPVPKIRDGWSQKSRYNGKTTVDLKFDYELSRLKMEATATSLGSGLTVALAKERVSVSPVPPPSPNLLGKNESGAFNFVYP